MPTISFFSDIFFPHLRMIVDVFCEQLNAFAGSEVNDFDAVFPQPINPTAKVHGLPTTTVAIPNWRINPLQYQHGARVVAMILSR
jgi:hypothetical protein